MYQSSVAVTGCDSGLGLALCRLLPLNGFCIFAGCKTSKGVSTIERLLWETKSTLSCTQLDQLQGKELGYALLLDVTDDESVESFRESCCAYINAKRIPPLYGVINNAGIWRYSLIETDMSYQTRSQELKRWYQVLDTNVIGTVRITLALLPTLALYHKQFGRRARVIFISSVLDSFALPGQSSYVASKHAIRGFRESLSLDLYRSKVDAISVSPGALDDTCLFDKDLGDAPLLVQSRSADIKTSLCVLKRFGSSCKGAAKTVVGALLVNHPRMEYRNTAGTLFFRLLRWFPRCFYLWLVHLIFENLSSLMKRVL